MGDEKQSCLLLGYLPFDESACREYLETENVELQFGTSLEQLKEACDRSKVDHVILGSGLNSEERIKMIRFVTGNDPSITIHMKDWDSKREGILPFVKGILESISRQEA